MTVDIKELIEKLAAIEHQRWSDWHKHCVKNWNVAMVSRWNNQANTPYNELSESEKESYRREVMRYWPLIIEAYDARIRELEENAIDYFTEKGGLLEKIESLESKNERLLKSSHNLSKAYLRVRSLVNAFDTPTAPSAAQIYKHTEDKIAELIAKNDNNTENTTRT